MSAPARRPAVVLPPVRPPLKWAGGKRWLIPLLAELWRPYRRRRLVEPFCGGLAITLGLRPARALLNDVNPHPVNFYRWLQHGLQIGVALRNDETLYYRHREAFNRLVRGRGRESRRAAELFYYLNRTGYNGLCRFNRSGEFNVPFGRYARINYARDFSAYRDVFSGWTLGDDDFGNLRLGRNDFVYADPPYDVEFRQYSEAGFDWSEQQRLAAWLAAHPGPVVVSNQATPRIIDLYREHGFEWVTLSAPRMISCTGDRRRAQEVLAARNLGAGALREATARTLGLDDDGRMDE